MAEDKKSEEGLFRYGVISAFLRREFRPGEKAALLKDLAEQVHRHPLKGEVIFSPETIRKWLKKYREGGFDALKGSRRGDIGKPRKVSPEVIQKAVALKQEVPYRTLDKIIRLLEMKGIIKAGQLSKTALHRQLKALGMSRRKPSEKQVYDRYESPFVNYAFEGDEAYGPWLPAPGKEGKSYQPRLFCLMETKSRLIVHAEFYPRGDFVCFEDCLRKAIKKYGLPKILHFDRGRVFDNKRLKVICARLGMKLILAAPYSPSSKGLIESWFRFWRMDFVSEVKVSRIKTLDDLNAAFSAWLDQRHQNKIHSQLDGKTPLEYWLNHKENVIYPGDQQMAEAFYWRKSLTVRKDHTFSWQGIIYEVDRELARKQIDIIYDPQSAQEVKIYYQGRFFQIARPLIKRNVTLPLPKKKPIVEPPPTGVNYLQMLQEQAEGTLKTQLDGGYLTSEDIVSALCRKKRDGESVLYPTERELLDEFFSKYGPIGKALALEALQDAVSSKGKKMHMSYYLDVIKKVVLKKRTRKEEYDR